MLLNKDNLKNGMILLINMIIKFMEMSIVYTLFVVCINIDFIM